MQKVFRPTVRMAIFNEGKILLCKHARSGIWSLPGGWIDWWETIDEALEREAMEELNIRWTMWHVIFMQDFLVEFNDQKTHNHFLEYICTVKNEADFKDVLEVYKDASHAFELWNLDWFSLDEIPETMKPKAVIPVLKEYLATEGHFTPKYIPQISKND